MYRLSDSILVFGFMWVFGCLGCFECKSAGARGMVGVFMGKKAVFDG